MKKEIPNPWQDTGCFFRRGKNPEGLRLRFYWDDEAEEVSAEYTPAQHFVGQGNIIHGALQMGFLDEIMGWTSYVYTAEMAVTSELNVRFIRPVYLRRVSKVTCKVTSKEGSKVHMHATIRSAEGTALTTATGVYHILPQKKYQDVIHGK